MVTIKVIRQLYEADMKMLGACGLSWAQAFPLVFWETGHVWCLASFLWMRASYEVFVAVLCSSSGTLQSTPDEVVFADSCMEWQSPSAVNAWIFFADVIWSRKCPLQAVVLSVNGQTYYPPRTEKDAKKVKKGKKSKKDTADCWFFTWFCRDFNLSQLQQLIPRQGMR